MRDQQTKRPIIPPPLVATEVECVSCQDLTDRAEWLVGQLGLKKGDPLPPWWRVVMVPAPPEEDDEDDETPVASE